MHVKQCNVQKDADDQTNTKSASLLCRIRQSAARALQKPLAWMGESKSALVTTESKQMLGRYWALVSATYAHNTETQTLLNDTDYT
jgi:hypothetical protein